MPPPEPFFPRILALLEATLALALAVLVTFTLGMIVFGAYGALAPADGKLPAEDAGNALQTLLPVLLTAQAMVLIGLGLLLIRLRVRPETDVRRSSVAASVGLGLGAAVVSFALSFAMSAVLRSIGWPVQEQQWILDLARDPARLLLMVPWIVVLAPVAEEVFLRSYMFRFLCQRAGPATGYLGSSFFFSVVHWNPSAFLIYMTIGLVLAFVYRRSSNLLAPITGHVCFNAMATAALYAGIPSGQPS